MLLIYSLTFPSPGSATSPSLKANFRCMISASKVFPAPFGPTTAHCCPSSIRQLTGPTKRNSGKRVTTCFISTTMFLSFSIFFSLNRAKVRTFACSFDEVQSKFNH